MVVMHILSSNRFSGAENVVCQIISSFNGDADYKFVYCSPRGDIEKTLESKGITFFGLDKMSLSDIKKAVKIIKPDIIHAHDMNASFLASFVKKVPVVSHIHNNSLDSRKLTLKSLAYLLRVHRFKHIFWVSDDAKNGYFFRKAVKNKSSVLNNIVDIKMIKAKLTNEKPQLMYDAVFLGRMVDIKNPFRALNICKTVLSHNKKASFVFVGDGPLLNELKDSVDHSEFGKSIHFLGFLNNPYIVLSESKCLLMTSVYEGLPMAVLEASSLGKPIISTPVDGVKNIVTNGFNGFVSDDDSVLANHILNLIADEELYNRLCANQLAFSEKWNDTVAYKNAIKKVYIETHEIK